MVSDRPNKKPAPATRPEQAAGVITKTEYHELATSFFKIIWSEVSEARIDIVLIYYSFYLLLFYGKSLHLLHSTITT